MSPSPSDHQAAPDRSLPDARPTQAETEQLLALRVTKQSLRHIVAIIGAVGAVLGYFGYDAIRSVREVETELRAELAAARDDVRAQQQRVDSLADVLKQQLELMTLRAALAQETLRGGRDELQRAVAQASSLSSTVALQLARAADRSIEMDSILDHIARERAAIVETSRRVDASQVQVASDLTSFRQNLTDLQGRVYGSGLFVIKEKERTAFPEHGLVFSMATIRGGLLRQFRIEEIASGATIWGPKDLSAGTPIGFRTDTLEYRATPRWFLEFGGGKDVAGFDIRWERRRQRID